MLLYGKPVDNYWRNRIIENPNNKYYDSLHVLIQTIFQEYDYYTVLGMTLRNMLDCSTIVIDDPGIAELIDREFSEENVKKRAREYEDFHLSEFYGKMIDTIDIESAKGRNIISGAFMFILSRCGLSVSNIEFESMDKDYITEFSLWKHNLNLDNNKCLLNNNTTIHGSSEGVKNVIEELKSLTEGLRLSSESRNTILDLIPNLNKSDLGTLKEVMDKVYSSME